MWLALFERILAVIIYPIVAEMVRRRELDPKFKEESDKVFDQILSSRTTKERQQAARKLYELQKKG